MKGGRFAAYWLSGVTLVMATALPVAPAIAATTVTINSPSLPLNIRGGPARWYPRIGTLQDGVAVRPVCHVRGQLILGAERHTDRWDRLPSGGYISDAYVRRGAALPACGTNAKAVGSRWTHPLPGFVVQGGFRTQLRPRHQGVDLMSFRGTPVRAAADGTVLEIVCDIEPGGSCDVPGSPSSRGCGWYVKLGHPGRFATLYCHLLRHPNLRVGQRVTAGQTIGLVGTSGRSSFPHLHYEVHMDAPPTSPLNAIDPLDFMRSVGAPMPMA